MDILNLVITNQISAIEGYTSDSWGTFQVTRYGKMNPAVEMLDKELEECSSYQGIVYRGCNLSNIEFEDNIFFDRGFLSTSLNRKLVEDKYVPFNGALLIINSKTGRLLPDTGNWWSEEEAEVLFMRNTKFKLLNTYQEVVSWYGDDPIEATVFELEEL